MVGQQVFVPMIGSLLEFGVPSQTQLVITTWLIYRIHQLRSLLSFSMWDINIHLLEIMIVLTIVLCMFGHRSADQLLGQGNCRLDWACMDRSLIPYQNVSLQFKKLTIIGLYILYILIKISCPFPICDIIIPNSLDPYIYIVTAIMIPQLQFYASQLSII